MYHTEFDCCPLVAKLCNRASDDVNPQFNATYLRANPTNGTRRVLHWDHYHFEINVSICHVRSVINITHSVFCTCSQNRAQYSGTPPCNCVAYSDGLQKTNRTVEHATQLCDVVFLVITKFMTSLLSLSTRHAYRFPESKDAQVCKLTVY